MTGIRRLWSLESERRREEGTEIEGLEEVTVVAEQGDMNTFFFFFTASSVSNRQDGQSRTDNEQVFVADVQW